MTFNEWVFWIGTVVVITDAVIAWTHIVMYARGSKWRLYEEGIALMGTMGSYALVLTYVGLANMQSFIDGVPASTLRDYPERGIVRITIFGLLLLVLSRWLVLLIRNQRRARQGVK